MNGALHGLVEELRALRPSTDVNRLLLSREHREDEIGRLAYRRAINDVLDRLIGVIPPGSDETAGIRFRVEAACDGYSALWESDIPDGVLSSEDYLRGAHDAAEAIRTCLRDGESS